MGSRRVTKARCGPGRRLDFEALEPRLPLAVFTVTSHLDVVDSGDGMVSLREAILAANSDPDQDTIRFDLAGAEPILLGAALPTIAHSVIVDGWSQNQSSGPSTPTVQLSGENLTGNESGLVIATSHTQVQGLVIRDFGGYGIIVDGGAGFSVSHVTLQGNRIGTDLAGQTRRPNQLGGILVRNSSDNLIGGTLPGQGNLVSGNGGVGITLVGAGQIPIEPATDTDIEALLSGPGNQNTTTRNRVVGNVIGLAATGDSPLGNAGHGVWLDRAGGNWIGGPSAGEGNTVSGNGRTAGPGGQATVLDPLTTSDGIRITGSPIEAQNPLPRAESAWNRIQGNRIGTDPTGSLSFTTGGAAWLGNTGEGIRLGDLSLRLALRGSGSPVPLLGGPQHTLIGVLPTASPGGGGGGSGSGGGNTIFGNGGNGIVIDGPGLRVSEVEVSIPANLIEANAWIGGNHIGTSASGPVPLGNQGSGVLLQAGTQLNLVGGADAASRNVISANGAEGIHVQGTSTLLSRAVVGDAGSEGPYTVTPAAPLWAEFGTDYLTFTQTIQTTGAAGTAVYESVARLLRDPYAPAAQSPLKTQFNFLQGNYVGTDSSGAQALGNGANGIRVDQGAAYTGVGTVVRPNPTTGSDELEGAGNVISGNGGHGILARGIGSFSPGGVIADASGNPVDPDTTYVVVQGNRIGVAVGGTTSVANSGSGVVITEGARGCGVGASSFKEAWLFTPPGPNGINFEDAFRNIISGNLQHGVVIAGTDMDPGSLSDPLSWYDGITLQNFVSGNYIGVNGAGDAALGNGGSGIVVRQGARANGIGGFSTLLTPSAGNLIGGNGQHGILVQDTRQAPQLLPLPGPMVLAYQVANHNAIGGNLIGVNRDGVRLANGGDGIALINASGEEIGSLVLEGGNVVSGNAGNGIRVWGPQSAKNLIIGNYVGTSPLAVAELHAQPDLDAAPVGNDRAGIVLEAGARDNYLAALISTAKANYNLGNLLLAGLITFDSYQSLRARFLAESVAIPGVTDPHHFEIVAGPAGYQLITTPAPLRVMASRNVVEGSSESGIVVAGAGTTANRIQSAYVGTNRRGELLLNAEGSPINANRGIGVLVTDEATGNILGAESTNLSFRSNRAHIAPSGLAVHLSFEPSDIAYLEVDASQRWRIEGNHVVAGDLSASNPWSLPSGPSVGNFAGGPYLITEGQTLSLDGSATPGSLGPVTFAWDLNGDLRFDDAAGVNPTLNWNQLAAFGIGNGPQSRALWLRVTDSFGNVGYRKANLEVVNAPPELSISLPVTTAAVRGHAFSFTLTATDPSPLDQAAGFTFDIDWNGDSIFDETVAGPTGTVASHVFTDSGLSTIHIRATDTNGGMSGVVTLPITIVPWAVVTDPVTGFMDLAWGGTTGSDFLICYTAGSNILRIDEVVGESLRTTVVGGVTGRLLVQAQAGADTVVAIGFSRPILVNGGSDNDELFLIGTSGAATLSGGAGDDKFNLIGSTSNAAVFGDAGADELNLVTAAGGAVSFHGGTGNDILAISGSANAVVMRLYGEEDDDTLYVGDASLTVGILLDGGSGNDIILGGPGADTIEGGDGNDLLLGSIDPTGGADTIRGGAGDDMLIRGVVGATSVGGAILDGGAGRDIIVAGAINFFDAQASLSAIYFDEWLSSHSFAEKVAHVTGTPGGDNGAEYLVVSSSVLDDDAVDTVLGGPDADLIFHTQGADVVPDLTLLDISLDLDP